MRQIKLNFVLQLALPLCVLVTSLIISVSALFFWLTAQQNHLQLEQERRLAAAAVDTRLDFVKRNLGDYAVWDDTVTHMVLKRDYAWAEANLGPYLYKLQGYDYCLIIGPQGQVIYASAGERQSTAMVARIAAQDLDRVVAAVRGADGVDRRSVALMRVDGGPAIVAAGAIVPSSTTLHMPRGDNYTLVLIEKLDAGNIAPMARAYRLSGLHLVQHADDGGQALLSADKVQLGSLVWRSASPGDYLRHRIWPVLVAIILLACGGTFVLLKRSWRAVLARDLSQREALASAEAAAESNRQLVESQRSKQAELAQAVADAQADNARLNAIADATRQSVAGDRALILNQAADHLDDQVGSAASTLADAASALGDTAEQVRRTAQMSSASASQVAEASARTLQHLDALVPEADAITQSATVVADTMRDAVTAVSEARDVAIVAADRMTNLRASVDAIDGIVDAIGSLTSQSNLLALNAAIEAARAGEAGLGFAVVADEVRRLANDTGDLLAQVNRQVHAIRTTTEESERSTLMVGALLEPAVTASARIADVVGQQRASVDAISEGISLVTRVAGELVDLSTAAYLAARDGFAAADVVTSTAEGVNDQSSRLTDAVQHVQDRLRRSATMAD